MFDLRKGPEYLYRLFYVLPKQTAHQMKALEVQFYIQQWFHDKQGAKIMWSLTFLVWLEITLDMHLFAGGWLYDFLF